MKRIKYTKTKKPGLIKSVRNFRSEKNGALYLVLIDTEKMHYFIRNAKSYDVVRSTEKDGVRVPTCIRVLKRQARRALESMGVKFGIIFRGIEVNNG